MKVSITISWTGIDRCHNAKNIQVYALRWGKNAHFPVTMPKGHKVKATCIAKNQTKPKPKTPGPQNNKRRVMLLKMNALTLSNLWAACIHHSLWDCIPKEQALLHVGCYQLKQFRKTFFYFPCSFYHRLLLMFCFCLCNQVLSLLTTI